MLAFSPSSTQYSGVNSVRGGADSEARAKAGPSPCVSLQPCQARGSPLSFLPAESPSSSAAGLAGGRELGRLVPSLRRERGCPQTSGSGPTLSAPPPGRDDMLDVETDAYIHCVSAFVKLAQSEYQLLTDVIPEHHQKKTFDSLIQVPPRPGALTRCPSKSCPCRSLRVGQARGPQPSAPAHHPSRHPGGLSWAPCPVGTSPSEASVPPGSCRRPRRPWEPAVGPLP